MYNKLSLSRARKWSFLIIREWMKSEGQEGGRSWTLWNCDIVTLWGFCLADWPGGKYINNTLTPVQGSAFYIFFKMFHIYKNNTYYLWWFRGGWNINDDSFTNSQESKIHTFVVDLFLTISGKYLWCFFSYQLLTTTSGTDGDKTERNYYQTKLTFTLRKLNQTAHQTWRFRREKE